VAGFKSLYAPTIKSKVKNQKSNLGMQECGIQGRSNQKSNLKMHGDVKSNAFVAKKIKM